MLIGGNVNNETETTDELEILLGSRQVALSTGEEITVREYGAFIEGMHVDKIARQVIQGLQELFLELQQGKDFRLQDLSAVFGSSPDAMIKLLAMACDKPEGWVSGLTDEDGQRVLLVWWSMNQNFFLRRLVTEGLAQAILDQTMREKAGQPFSAGSSDTVTH